MTSTPPPPAAPLRLTEHPLQRCGAYAVTLLAERERVADVTAEHLDGVAHEITTDAVEAAMAPKGSGAYDWWKVLFALYPNSKPTHAKRGKDRVALAREVAALFAPDPVGGPLRSCVFCDVRSGTLWAKSTLPMFDSIRALNTLPPGTAGWPVCRGCRVAMWALPYGAWLTAGSASVLTSDNPQVEQWFAARNVRRARRIRQSGFKGLPASAGPEAVVLRALREHAGDAPAGTTLWTFKNDNQEPWLRVTGTRTGVARFLRHMEADPDSAKGWHDLRRALESRKGQGQAAVDGATAVARLLFDRESEWSGRLLKELRARSADPEKLSRRTLIRWRALCRLHVEVMDEMDPDRIKPVADLLAEWIAQDTPRGRFNEYRRAAGSGWELHKLLMTAGARLCLDGKPRRVDTEVLGDLLASGSPGWRERTLLFFEVISLLMDKQVAIGIASADTEEDKGETMFDDDEEYA